MSLGDSAYIKYVPLEAQELADERGLGECNWFIRGADVAPYYPDSFRNIFAKAAALTEKVAPPSSKA